MTVSQNLAATYLDPEDIVDDISVLRFSIKQLIAKMETMVPVSVVAVQPGSGSPPAAGTVTVMPLLTMLDGDGNATQPTNISNIPYFRLQGGPWAVVCDPAVGDQGFIVSSYRDISNVVKNPGGGVQNPGSYRRYSFSDGVYVGGAMNKTPAATLWLKPDGTFVLTTKDGVVIKSDGSGNLDATCTTMAVTGNITATGSIIAGFGGADQVGLQTHHTASFGTPPTPGT